MNLTSILGDLYYRLGYVNTSVDATVTARLKGFVNQAQRQILTQPSLSLLRDDTIPVASVANQSRYGLPPAVAKIQHVGDRTNNRWLAERPLGWLRTVDPGLVSVGGPSDYYIPLGFQQVQTQPSAATGLWAVSSTTDVTAKVFVETILTGGYKHIPATAGTALTSTARVQLGTRTDVIEVVKFYLDVAAAGFVSLYDAATAGTELARIEPGKLYSRYLAIQLWPTPTTAITYSVDYTRTIPDLINGTDEPLLPDDFHWLLVTGALIQEWGKKDDGERRLSVQREHAQGLNDLTAWVLINPDTVASLRPVAQNFSQLGPTYESGS